MQQYVIEWDLLAMYGRQLPVTRRRIIQAADIGEAVRLAEDSISPGQDCVSFRVHEVTDNDMGTARTD